MICGIEIVKDRATKAVFPRTAMVVIRIILEARPSGLIIRPLGLVLMFIPVLSMSEAEVDEVVCILFDSIACLSEQVRVELM